MNDDYEFCIDFSNKREGLPEYSDGPCPKCGGKTQTGFGLAGGGYGVYAFCDSCGEVVSKTLEEDA
jgi:hypothetical protein